MLKNLAVKSRKISVGDKIRIIKMYDSGGVDWQATQMNNRTGVVEYIDGAGSLHGTWGGLAVLPDVDEFEVIV